ncbi:putative F-box/FBD/LRR-repeat protein At4g03220 [Miscanthus floridulus]|uniref:putative F-box/FBD/LRR-repeat protein At4g03220 n=1 Tax=Miscanthus floridulus TaxID=154761 RepID=UPI003458DF21
MELGGGSDSAAKGQGLSSSDAAAAAAAAGEDRLSALPDDVLVLILLKLTTRAAAQTRVLSHRWRLIWALLPVLSFTSPPEPHRLRDALDGHKVLLRDLLVGADGATAQSLAVWLPAAARRVSGDLTLKTYGPEEDAGEDDSGGEEEAAQRGAFEFPCFEQASKISFFLGFQGLAVPLTGVFARLTGLHLSRVWFHGPGELGDAVSSPRCPCLQRLTVEDARGLRDLAIHSESMLWMELRDLHALSRLTVVAPALEVLTVASCFPKSPPVANISAPLLTKLHWGNEYDPSSVHLGKMAHLQWLRTPYYLVYGNGGFLHNQSCLSLLQRFEGIKSLCLTLAYLRGIENYDYMMEDMAVLPDITFLRLMVMAYGHAFEASAFHVLRLCTGIRRLMLLFLSEAETVCTSDCKCLQLIEWETEELLLNHLEEVEIFEWRGTKHEVAFVKRLFDWGTKIKKMTVNFCPSISEVKAKELYQIFQSFSRPGVCMKFYRFEKCSKVLCT